MPRVLTWVARTRSPELFLLVVLAIAIGTAALTQAAGLSLALGAFLAGLLVSESDYAHETLARVLPLRDAFVALFFVTLGALIDPRVALSNLPLLAVMIGLVLVGKLASGRGSSRSSVIPCGRRCWSASASRRSASSRSSSSRPPATPVWSAPTSTTPPWRPRS